MDFNDPDSSIEYGDDEQQNEVVPSSETSISDNELTTTITEHKQSPVDCAPSSNGANSICVKNQLHTSGRNVETNAAIEPESDGGGSGAGVKSESESESESRLVIQSENETTDNDTAASTLATTTIKENGGTASLKKSAKRKSTAKINNKQQHNKNDINDDVNFGDASEFSDDDEKFMGFTVEDISKCTSWAPSVLLKRIKTDSPNSTATNLIEDKVEQKTPKVKMNDIKPTVEPTPVPVPVPPPPQSTTPPKPPTVTTATDSPAHIIKTDPRYRNPFKFGWRREVVFRANLSSTTKSDNRGEVYYHSPSGRKLRTKNEISTELRALKDQSLDIGDFSFAKESIGMPVEQEIVRSAKVQTPSQKRPQASLPEAIPTPEVLGKRIPKPKMPKGASPPPPSSIGNKSRTPATSNKRQPEREIIEVIQPKAAKINSKSNREPCTINCVLAMGIIPQLQCKKCQFMYHHECVGKDGSRHITTFVCEHCKREKSEAAQSAQAAAAAAAAANKDQQIENKMVNANSTEQLTTPIRPMKKAPLPNSLTKSATSTPTNAKSAKDDTAAPTEHDLSAPQSIAIVAGRKYIMVPKTAKIATTPDSVNGNQTTKSSSRPHTPVAGSKSTSSRSSSTANRTSPSLPAANNVYASAPASVHSVFASEFFNNVSRGYDILFNIFQYLKVQELLRASSVCRMWNHVANNSILWQTVRMKNSQANDWTGLMAALRRHGTRHLDLRKILISSSLDWNDFITHISRVPDLETLHLCRCPSEVVTALLETNTNLQALNALSITGNSFSFPTSCNMPALRELRLSSGTKSSGSSMSIENLRALLQLDSLRHLSLTSFESLDANQLEPLASLTALESLELGKCNNLAGGFAKNILIKLRNLERLRLEDGKGCATFDILEAIEKLPKLVQLELVNFDIKPGFDTRIAQCRRLKRLLIIPTYISQSATTNNLVLSSIAHLGDTLQSVTWVVTQELIRVTDLYTDECHEGQPRKPNEDKIPIIKPVPMMRESPKINTSGEASTQLVEILPLSQVDKIIRTNIPKLNLKIQKVPFTATWRQTISETS
ncbi:uncharacterized protein LOC129574468 isoform X1 [Sitodiplosis mosellana]|uniref:uncharacterized protein LOC129574468 isoform X1 n=1 Tax=Sitodiplosis mosellana TaxID=263140 RepID=UPI0024441A5D|nr:uncharacterized protein LOC129574468 isoform X1 [Sitodiplosis mosellana]